MATASSWLARPHPGSACTIIAEVSQAHDGSLGMAHAFIDAAAAAGADAVKFQTHIAHAESTPAEPWRASFSSQDATRLDYWRRMEFRPEQWQGLREHAARRGLLFLSSPFSLEAVELLERLGVAGWKIASGEINHFALLDATAATGRPVMLSTGMSPLAEVDAAVERVRSHGVPLAVLQCTSLYPCPPELVGLNLIPEFRARYGCAVGLSDHSATIYPGLAAAALGIEVLEVHITLSREMFGPDVVASVTTAELRQLVVFAPPALTMIAAAWAISGSDRARRCAIVAGTGLGVLLAVETTGTSEPSVSPAGHLVGAAASAVAAVGYLAGFGEELLRPHPRP